MNYTHVITYPSVWLPDHACKRILVLGGDHTWLEHVQLVLSQTRQNWALYVVSDSEARDTQIQDWLLLNSCHVHACWCNVSSMQVLMYAALLKHVQVVHVHPEYEKLVQWGGFERMNLDHMVITTAQAQES